jgi:hypothetical protein
MKHLLKLTSTEGKTILIGTQNIIDVTPDKTKDGLYRTKVFSTGAMVQTNWVLETVEEIYNQSIS